MAARIVIPPRGLGAGTTDTDTGKYLAYVDVAVYVPAKNRAGIELPEIVFYEADPEDSAQKIRSELEDRVRAAFGAPAKTPVLWMNV
jgi:hypothetical protein